MRGFHGVSGVDASSGSPPKPPTHTHTPSPGPLLDLFSSVKHWAGLGRVGPGLRYCASSQLTLNGAMVKAVLLSVHDTLSCSLGSRVTTERVRLMTERVNGRLMRQERPYSRGRVLNRAH